VAVTVVPGTDRTPQADEAVGGFAGLAFAGVAMKLSIE
jgi:hypothetical protein